jgi:WhiB family redox-sensing transcriptional regulator
MRAIRLEINEFYKKVAAVFTSEWRDHALCLDTEEGLFFDPDRVEEAKTFCDKCPCRMECLNDAISFGDSMGVRGGLTEEERVKLTARQRRYSIQFRADVAC